MVGRLDVKVFLNKLRAAGASTSEALDYGHQYAQQIDDTAVGAAQPSLGMEDAECEATPEGLDNEQQASFREQ